MAKQTVANRIFVGYSWKTYKAHWEPVLEEMHKKYPLHFLAIGRDEGQPAAQLLTKILEAIDKSTIACFDASGGNPNVALEYGYARALLDNDNDIFLFLDENATSTSGPGSPIISDLAGSIANRYALNNARLKDHLIRIAEQHHYNIRFKRFCKQRKYKGGTQRFLIRIIRQLDGKDSMLRRELIDNLIHETNKSESYIDAYLKELNKAALITISKGNQYSSRIHISG